MRFSPELFATSAEETLYRKNREAEINIEEETNVLKSAEDITLCAKIEELSQLRNKLRLMINVKTHCK